MSGYGLGVMTSLALLLCLFLPQPAFARPVADAQSVVLEGTPDFSQAGQATVTLRNTGSVRARLIGIETTGPLGLVGLPELSPLAPGKTRTLQVAWGEPTGAVPQLLVRTAGGTAILPRLALDNPRPRVADAAESAILIRALPRLVYCYQQAASLDPTIEGFVEVVLTVTSDGSVGSAGILETTLPKGGTESCLTTRLLELQFPAPADAGDRIKYPFSFLN